MDFDTRSGSGDPSRHPGGVTRQAPDGEFDLSDPVRSFVNTVQRVIFSPRDFFRGMLRTGSFLNLLIFIA
jgi:hypothetical protein